MRNKISAMLAFFALILFCFSFVVGAVDGNKTNAAYGMIVVTVLVFLAIIVSPDPYGEHIK